MDKILALLGLVVIIAGIYMYMGYYNISSTNPHHGFIEDIIQTVKYSSIERHSKDIKKPQLTREEVLEDGFIHYDIMCVQCHGAPGITDLEMREGLYPRPPLFPDEIRDDMTVEQIFWIAKNGIKMSGMPAYGPTHSDEELWQIAAFVERLGDITQEEYGEMKEKYKNGHEHHHDHHHSH